MRLFDLNGRLWVRQTVLDELVQEADRTEPRETGGILAGYWSASGEEAVVSSAIGPGPHAFHELHAFEPDYDYQREQVGEIFDASSGRITYLGDWHSHPRQTAYLSWKDRAALRRIARNPQAYAPIRVMLILGWPSEAATRWEPRAWVLRKHPALRFWLPWEYVCLPIHVY